MAPARRVSRDKLIACLWPDRDAEAGRNLLKVSTYVLRSLLGDSALLSESDGDNCLPRLRAHFADLRATATAGEDGGHAVTDVKFMILGNGYAGKTQIVRRLRGEPFDPAVPSTHGIQVKEAKLATDAGELPIVLRIWDFGGQDSTTAPMRCS